MNNINKYASNLTQDSNGIWMINNNDKRRNSNTKSKNTTDIYYPSDGNEQFCSIEDGSFWFRYRNRIINMLLNKFPPPDTPLLEIGAGNGFVSRAIELAGIPVIALEPDIFGALNCQKRGLNNVICAPFEDVEFTAGSIKSAGLFDVLEHIPHPVPFLKRIRKHLKKNALLYITVPSYQFLFSPWDKQVGHFRRYTLNMLKYELSKAGFSIRFQTHFMSALFFPVLFFRTLPGILFKKESIWKSSSSRSHIKYSSLPGLMAQKVQSIELVFLQKGVIIPFGTSCMAIACAE